MDWNALESDENVVFLSVSSLTIGIFIPLLSILPPVTAVNLVMASTSSYKRHLAQRLTADPDTLRRFTDNLSVCVNPKIVIEGTGGGQKRAFLDHVAHEADRRKNWFSHRSSWS